MKTLSSLLRMGPKPAGPEPGPGMESGPDVGEKGCVRGMGVPVPVEGDVGRSRGNMEGRTEGAGVVGLGRVEGREGRTGLGGADQFSSSESSKGMPSNTSCVANVRSSEACTVRCVIVR